MGPPASGKTTTLAARATRLCDRGAVVVICPNEASRRSFARAAGARSDERIAIDTLPGHLASWMRSEFALAQVRPMLRVGGPAAARAIARVAARGLLDMTWPMFRGGEFDLDIPFLSRPDGFLDEAADLIRLLRRQRIGPDEFERGCAAGLHAFYGEDGESALARLRDPQVQRRLSKRGAQASRASRERLWVQRRAERDLGKILATLYREYLACAPGAAEWSEEDVADHGAAWLRANPRAAARVAARFVHVLVDDAEDAEPALPDVLEALSGVGTLGMTIAGWDESQLEGFHGKRSILRVDWHGARRVTLPPREHAGRHAVASRFVSEVEEVEWLVEAIAQAVGSGSPPDNLAVLARSVDSACVYAESLERRGIPIDPPAAIFAESKEIADLLALAAAVDDPTDHAHLLRVLHSELLGLNDASVWTLCRPPHATAQLTLEVGAREAQQRATPSIRRTLLSDNFLTGDADDDLNPEVRDRLAAFRLRFLDWLAAARGQRPGDTVERLIDGAGFAQRWRTEPDHRRRRLEHDARRLTDAFARAHELRPCARLRDLVNDFEDGVLAIAAAQPTAGAVTVEAIPDTKGRRFDRVFVVGIAHERFPRIYVPRALAFSRAFGLIARENVADGAAQTAKYAWYYARFDAKDRYLKEERRMLRYGLSRGADAAVASGFGAAPAWARDHDLLKDLGA